MKRSDMSGLNRTHPSMGKERGKARNGNEDETNENNETTISERGKRLNACPRVVVGTCLAAGPTTTADYIIRRSNE